MNYSLDLAIPSSTPASAPVVEEIELPKGVITDVEIDLYAGHHGLAKVRVVHNEFQIYPSNPDAWYSGEDVTIAFTDRYSLPEAWNYVTFEGYNEDTVNQHGAALRLTVEEKLPQGLQSGWSKFIAALREV